MVIKGSARAAPGELAYHLLREDTNESVRVMEFSGVASLDLREALAELDGMGAGSRSRRTLYHASINTPVSEQLTEDQQRTARQRLAEQLSLAGQPFAMVEHVKAGRQHTHVVWSRIDLETGKAIPDSHNYRRHEEVSRELEREFGHNQVLGAHVRDKEAEPRPPRGPNWGEQRQAERSGLTPTAAKTIITELWRHTTTGQDFRKRLQAKGFTLARGDRRDFVLIDGAGEVHGLSRRIGGAKAAQIRERMADVDADQLPDVAGARHQLQQRQKEQDNAVTSKLVGASERIRAEELVREEKAGKSGRPLLRSADQEVADALWQLGKTMRGQLETVVVSGNPETLKTIEHPSGSNVRPATVEPAAIDPAPAPSEPEKRSLLQRLAGWVRGKDQDAAPPPAAAKGAKLQKEAATLVAATSPQATQQPSVEVETGAGEWNRPSAYLFIRIFGYLVDAYQQAIDRSLTAEPAPSKPAVEDLADVIARQLAARTDAEKAAARAAALLREQEERQQGRARELKND